ncbi:MAG: RNA-binding transcriptional accessory protein [Firmicutes bacterium]|nr:RNA-binding transcriptional accessory protein [Bacillota bacterium]
MIKKVSEDVRLPSWKVENTVKLLDEKSTIPFIARYRKEATGELDETQISRIEELLSHYRNLLKRKEEVIRLIDEQGKLTEELRAEILAANTQAEVEDLYRPFRPKRTTRASVARERGLEPLAEYLLSFPLEGSPEVEAEGHLTELVPTVKDALQGAMDIVAERVSDDPEVRRKARDLTRANGLFIARAKEPKPESPFRNYDDFKAPVRSIAPHQVMAVNRAERQEYLAVKIEVGSALVLDYIYRRHLRPGVTAELVKAAIDDAYQRLIAPAVEREIRGELTDRAEEQAITVFSKNLRSLLMQRPVKGKVVLGIDPGQRTGSKIAVVNEQGDLLETDVIYPIPPHNRVEEAFQKLSRMLDKHGVNAITLGNGTGSRQIEELLIGFLKRWNRPGLAYTIVSEAGASVYSASKLAAQEFPDLDLSLRSAVSIARRVQDPLAELVKIPPKSAGVGQYQHDLPPKELDESLARVVELCVNSVGVDLNTASPALLRYVSGVNATVAENIVRFRRENGRFSSREQLKKVPKLGPKSFEQSAGFLRVSEPGNPLDATAVHPESYHLAKTLLEMVGSSTGEIGSEALKAKMKDIKVEEMAALLECGVPTLRDIVDSLLRPGRDPREDLPAPVFRTDVKEMADLKPGMGLTGTVRSVTDWGVYVDIGVKQDGMVHKSQLAGRFVRHPLDVVSVGDIIQVWVLEVDLARKRIGLTMRRPGEG